MEKRLSNIKVAAVHAAPIFLNCEASAEKACELISEAGKQGAKQLVFSRSVSSGLPLLDLDTPPRDGAPLFCDLFENAVEIPGDITGMIGEAARKAGIFVVMGMSERAAARFTIPCLYFDDHGRILGRHRKLPAHPWRNELSWGKGDGSDLDVFDTPIG